MQDKTKALIAKLVKAGATSLITQNPLAGVGAAVDLAEWASTRAEAVEKRIERNFLRVTAGINADERNAALGWATEAVKRAGLALSDLAEARFDVPALTDRVAGSLDVTLAPQERHRAREAIRLTYETLIGDAKKNNAATFELALLAVRNIERLTDQVAVAAGNDKNWASPAAAARGRVDAHRLADPSHVDVYIGKRAGDVTSRMSWDWEREVRQRIESLTGALVGQPSRVVRAVNDLLLMPFDETYPSMWRRLQAPEAQHALRVISDTIGGAAAGPRVSIDARGAAARWLRAQADRPEFGLAFPISGQWGAGKSRLLDEIAEGCVSKGWVVIHADARDPAALEGSILAAAARNLGANLTSTAGLHRELNGRPGACVLIDDWEVAISRDRSRNSELLDLISAWSALPVRWVVAADESFLPLVLGHGASRLWQHYGWRSLRSEPALPVVSGWLQLADDNEDQQLGLTLLTHHLGPSPEIDAVRNGSGGSRFVRRELSQPLLALLRVAAGTTHNLDEIHLVGMLETYWRRMVDAVTIDRALPAELVDGLCSAIARQTLTGGPVIPDSLSFVAPLPQLLPTDRRHAQEEALRLLLGRRLLSVAGNAIHLDESFALVWGFLLSREFLPATIPLLVEDSAEFLDRMRRLAALETAGVPAAGAALRFVLLAVATDSVAADRHPAMWLAWLRDAELPLEVLWQAAPALPPARQQELVSAAMQRGATADEAFWAIRLVRLLPDMSSGQALSALRFLTRVSGMVEHGGLTAYLLASLRWCIQAIDWGRTADARDALTLLERVGVLELSVQLAKAVVERLPLDEPGARGSWVDVMLSFLATVTSRARSKLTEPMAFWEALTDISLERMGREAGPHMLEELFEYGWYSTIARTERDRHVSWVMRRIGHVCFGHTWAGHPEEFMDVLSMLLRHGYARVPRERQAAAALFGIRHSVPTHGATALVDADFGPALKALQADRSLSSRDRESLRSISVRRHPRS